MKDSFAKYLIKKTEDDYNKISSLFSNKRSYITPDLEKLGDYVKKGENVLDLGCGNGRFFEVMKKKEVRYLGIDFSESLIKIAKSKYHNAVFKNIDNVFNLKEIGNEVYDVVFCLAVFHHIPGKKYRLVFLNEINRLLKLEGRLVLTVWDLWAKEDARKLIYRHAITKLFGQEKMDFGDIYYPFCDQNGNVLANRYLHAFTAKELSHLLKKSGFDIVSMDKNKRGHRVINQNIVVIATKR